MLCPHLVGSGGAANGAMWILDFGIRFAFAGDKFVEHPVGGLVPALAAIAGSPDTPAGDGDGNIVLIGRIDFDGVDSGIVVSSSEPLASLRFIPECSVQFPAGAPVR